MSTNIVTRQPVILSLPQSAGVDPRPCNWPLTPRGTAARLLALLDRPRQGAGLDTQLGVSQQRVHQIVVDLVALGHVRCAEPHRPTHFIARASDRSLLLRYNHERVLSAVPDIGVASVAEISRLTGIAPDEAAATADKLVEAGLFQPIDREGSERSYRLTPAGSVHPQRSWPARRALPYPSSRVHQVLAYLNDYGPTRTIDLACRLWLERTSLNALLQKLKKKKLVQTQPAGRAGAPYVITPDGCKKLLALRSTLPPDYNPYHSSPEARGYIPPQPFRSDRISRVLAHLDENGPTRTIAIARQLRLKRPSLNALMQSLKHRKVVKNQPAQHAGAPYVLTTEGRQKLIVMRQAQPALSSPPIDPAACAAPALHAADFPSRGFSSVLPLVDGSTSSSATPRPLDDRPACAAPAGHAVGSAGYSPPGFSN